MLFLILFFDRYVCFLFVCFFLIKVMELEVRNPLKHLFFVEHKDLVICFRDTGTDCEEGWGSILSDTK